MILDEVAAIARAIELPVGWGFLLLAGEPDRILVTEHEGLTAIWIATVMPDSRVVQAPLYIEPTDAPVDVLERAAIVVTAMRRAVKAQAARWN